ncbi:hypothetical protein DFH08DRAFT_799062 [Mycena albidolilacea]|uniref:Uncharacterized protein n=1 Tax=Mycena albidolilacea TaxID=1033008 RepID=A0AAD7F2K3_9AGAR|nr:hypothetical protein DFH08DRAFT_799062 [Mycena albidolilacea]
MEDEDVGSEMKKCRRGMAPDLPTFFGTSAPVVTAETLPPRFVWQHTQANTRCFFPWTLARHGRHLGSPPSSRPALIDVCSKQPLKSWQLDFRGHCLCPAMQAQDSVFKSRAFLLLAVHMWRDVPQRRQIAPTLADTTTWSVRPMPISMFLVTGERLELAGSRMCPTCT